MRARLQAGSSTHSARRCSHRPVTSGSGSSTSSCPTSIRLRSVRRRNFSRLPRSSAVAFGLSDREEADSDAFVLEDDDRPDFQVLSDGVEIGEEEFGKFDSAPRASNTNEHERWIGGPF